MNEAAKNVVPVHFNGSREAFLEEEEGLVQYDYGQILKFEDIELPTAYTVHFGNEKEDGLSKPMIGDETGVEIPAEFLQTGLPVWAWIFLHEGQDDGETEYIVKIPVKRRSRPTNYAPTEIQQSAIDQAIAALNIAVEDAEEAKAAAEAAETGAEAAQEAAEAAKEAAQTAKTGAEAAKNEATASANMSKSYAVGGTGTRPGENTDNAKYYKEQTAAAASQALTDIESAKGTAVAAVQQEGASQVQAVRSEGQTQTAEARAQAEAAARSATAAAGSASAAGGSATAAAGSAASAEESKTAAAGSKVAAKASEDNAKASEEAAALSAEAARQAAESVISLNFTDFDTGTTYGYGLGIKGGYPALKIYNNTEG